MLAHNVHPTDDELKLLAARDAAVAHCPTSNCALGSGLFPLKRHLEAGVRVALGSDVGAGTGFCLFKEGLQAYFLQQLLGDKGWPLSPPTCSTSPPSAGADALGLADVGDLGVGKRFDALWLRPRPATTLDVALRNANGVDDALAKAFALACPADVERVWVEGEEIVSDEDNGGEGGVKSTRLLDRSQRRAGCSESGFRASMQPKPLSSHRPEVATSAALS